MELKKNNKKQILIWIISFLLLAAVVFLVIFIINKTAGKRIPKVSEKVVVRKEEIDPVKSGYVWSGVPEDPKKIVINKIGVDNFIQQVGVNDKKEVAAPTNIFLAGWYNKSVKPGKKGLSIIDGHLDGYTKPGIFNRLGELKAGDEYSVELGNGNIIKYRVFKIETVDTDRAAASLFSQNLKIKNQLNLITCGGNYDKNKQLYDKRIIVSAEQVS